MPYNLQAVSAQGAPGRDTMIAGEDTAAGMEWIKARFADGAARVHVWHHGGKRIATLAAAPAGTVSSLRDLIAYDSVQHRQAPLAPATKAPREIGEVIGSYKVKAPRAVPAVGTPFDMAGMINEEIASLKE